LVDDETEVHLKTRVKIISLKGWGKCETLKENLPILSDMLLCEDTVLGDSHSISTFSDCIKFKPAQFISIQKTFETKDTCAFNVCYGRKSLNKCASTVALLGEERTLGELHSCKLCQSTFSVSFFILVKLIYRNRFVYFNE